MDSLIRELPDSSVIRVVKLLSEGRDPFAFGRKKHKKIKGMRVQKRKVRVVRKPKGEKNADTHI